MGGGRGGEVGGGREERWEEGERRGGRRERGEVGGGREERWEEGERKEKGGGREGDKREKKGEEKRE